MASGQPHTIPSPEQDRRQRQRHQQRENAEMADVKPDSDAREARRPGSSSRHAAGGSSSRPASSHRLDTSGMANALPGSHPSNGVRARITVVCGECKRLKLKCDRRTPCGSCVKRDTTQRCLYAAGSEQKIDLQSVHNRLLNLEEKVSRIDVSRGDKPRETPRPSLMGVSNGSTVVVSLDDVNSVWLQELEVQFDVDLKVLEPDLPAEVGWAQIFPPPEVFFPSPEAGGLYGMPIDSNMPTVTPALLQRLPDGPLRDAIMSQFQNTLAMHPCTNWNDFDSRAQAMFSALSLQEADMRMSGSGSMYPAPPSPQVAPVSLTFFASVAAAFALGAQSLSEVKRWVGPSELPFEGTLPNVDKLRIMAEEFYSLSHSTLQVAQRTAAYDLDFLLTMRMQCLYLLHDGKPRVAHSILPEVGKMINIARSMGLHLDPDDYPGKYSILDAEMRKRVWWDIYYLDVFVSDCMALPPLIDDTTFNCKMPSDCDDLQLHARMHALPPPTEHSDYTYFILKSRLAQLVKEIGRRPALNEQKEPDMNLAMDLEQKVKEWLNALPPRFHLPTDEAGAAAGPPFVVAQRCELASIAQQIILKIYNPFLQRDGFSKKPSHQALLASTNAAHTLVLASKTVHNVLRHTRPATYMFYSFGRQLFHAAVITAHSIISDPHVMWLDTALRDLDAAIMIMRDPMIATGRGPARGGGEGAPSEALRVVQMLRDKCDQALRGSLPPGAKRRHHDLDPHLPANIMLPYLGNGLATMEESEVVSSPQIYEHNPHPHGMQYPEPAVVQPPISTPAPTNGQLPPQQVQHQPHRTRMPTHPPPESDQTYVHVEPTAEWAQQPQQKPSTSGKERRKNPAIGFRRRDTEPSSATSSRPHPATGGSSHSPVNMRKSSTFHGAPPTSGVTMPGAAQFQQAQQAQQQFAQQQQYAAPPQPEIFYSEPAMPAMYPPVAPQEPQPMFYGGAPQEGVQPETSYQGGVNPALISPDAHRSMPMHMGGQLRNNLAPSIPSTPVDPARYNTNMLPAPQPTKQDSDDADQAMLSIGEPAMNPAGYEVPMPNMVWDSNTRESYVPAQEQWQGYGFS